VLKNYISQYFFIISILWSTGCGPLDENEVSKVQQAWNARYQYDLENRRIVSIYENQKIGRATGRDEHGRINYDQYWVTRPFKGENLMKHHEAKLDSARENRWNLANRNLIEARKLKLSEVASNKDEKGGDEEEATEEFDDSMPVPFLPQGISIDSEEPPADLFPPMDSPGSPPFPDSNLNGPGMPSDPEAQPPSPFDPLPPL
jgi:hypothetical protein